jgi:hypothetical protein
MIIEECLVRYLFAALQCNFFRYKYRHTETEIQWKRHLRERGQDYNKVRMLLTRF